MEKARARAEFSTLEKAHKLPLPSPHPPPPTLCHSLERAKLSISVGKTEHFFYIWALPNCSQPPSHTPIHLSRKTTHFHPFFKKSDPLPLIFQEKWPTLTHFSRKTTHSHAFLTKNDTLYPFSNQSDPLPPNFQEKRPAPTNFLTNTSNSQSFLMENVPPPHSFNN